MNAATPQNIPALPASLPVIADPIAAMAKLAKMEMERRKKLEHTGAPQLLIKRKKPSAQVAILAAVREHGEVGAREVAEITGYNRSTVSRHLLDAYQAGTLTRRVVSPGRRVTHAYAVAEGV